MKKAFYVTLLFFMVMGMSGCGGGGVNLEDGGEGPVDATSSGNVIHPWNGQTLGLIKVYVRHAYKGGNKKVASYVAKGSGLLFLQKDGHYEVVTARHLVFPDIGLKSLKVKKKTIEFDSVAEAESTVVVGPIAVKPERFLYLKDSNLDIARLEIGKDSDEEALLFGIQNPNINGYFQESPDLEKSLNVGDKVSAYGFPGEGSAAPSAQIKELQVASMTTDRIVLNDHLEPGYSGGVVWLDSGSERKVVGMIIRSDPVNKQSIIIPWPRIYSTFLSRTKEIIPVENGESTVFGQVKVNFSSPHDYQLEPKKSWWNFWD
jgi:hypothetical protein